MSQVDEDLYDDVIENYQAEVKKMSGLPAVALPTQKRVLTEAETALDDLAGETGDNARKVLQRFLIAYYDLTQIVNYIKEDSYGRSMELTEATTQLPSAEGKVEC
eukprot:Blabericola_migrator_1__6610@NODE_3336_length_1848_cov_8_879281_g2009_i1_p4_GENE_NODE_3336_length_1848_cov_8_879281_g2009_i1NODE_3336_length_1848_cov_8_879281_g2009_i1_p4_ORF_typecomplete_len105_score24_48_NODE_3336_length_1848_cov_8_879281_g2009_i19941308